MTFSHKLVAYWDKGTQINSPVQRDLSAGVAFSGRSYRLNGSQTRTAEQAETNTPAQEPNQADGVAFRGRGYRLNGR
jgi:Derlin-2/3